MRGDMVLLQADEVLLLPRVSLLAHFLATVRSRRRLLGGKGQPEVGRLLRLCPMEEQ